MGRLAGLLAFLGLVLAAGAAAQSEERDSLLTTVDRLRAKGDLQRALRAASSALNRFPEDLCLHARYQDIQLLLGREAAVKEEYRLRWIARQSASDICLFARLLDDESAVRAYRQALAEAPDYFWAHYGIGVAYLRQGDLDTARRHLVRAQSLRPRSAAPKIRLGQLLELAHRPRDALEQYRLAVAVGPQAASPLFQQFFALMAQKRIKEAEEVTQDLLGHHSPEGAALGCLARGALFSARGDFASAVPLLEQALERSTRHRTQLLELLGDGLADAGRTDEAITAYRRALARDEKNLEARLGLGRLLAAKGDREAAERTFAAACRVAARVDHSHEAEPLFLRGVIAEDEGRLWNALYFYRRAAEHRRDAAEYRLALGALHERLDQPEKAVAAYVEASRLDAFDPTGLLQAGLVEASRERFDRALKLVEAALARDPRLLDARLAAGTLCQDELRRPADAERHYRAYLGAGGKDRRVREWIAELSR